MSRTDHSTVHSSKMQLLMSELGQTRTSPSNARTSASAKCGHDRIARDVPDVPNSRRRAILFDHIVADVVQAMAKRTNHGPVSFGRARAKYPVTGMAGCSARAGSGQVAAAP